MQSCGRSSDRTFVFREYGLKPFFVFLCRPAVDEIGQRRFAECVESLLELIVRPVIKEPQCAASRCGIVYDFGHHRLVFAEIELVAYPYLPGRVYKHIPQTQLFIQFTQEENFYPRSGLFLIAEKPCRKHFGVIEDEYVLIVKIVEHILEYAVLYGMAFLMQHHETRLIAIFRGIKRNLLLRKFEFEL